MQTGDASISVVIPVYNCPDRIIGAVQSALTQSPKPLEIILVDDASSDPIDEKFIRSMDPCIRVIHHEANRGGSAARNTGIDAARGRFVALLDADDRWLPEKFATQLEQLRDQHDKVFACANVIVDRGPLGQSNLYNARPPYFGEDISRYFLIHFCTFQTSTLFVPTKLARFVRFDDRLRRHQDWDFVLRLIASGAQYSYFHEPLAVYWDGSTTGRVSQQKAIGPALFWLDVAEKLIAPDAAAAFYFRTTFRKHFREEPRRAVLMALRLALKDRKALTWMIKRVPGFRIAP